MRFPFPCLPAEFEIPDEWWQGAGMDSFLPAGLAFRSSADAQTVALRDIEPPFRFRECPLDWRGFSRHRFVLILRGIAAGDAIPAVPVVELPLSRVSTRETDLAF
jgi:hypothetical protein